MVWKQNILRNPGGLTDKRLSRRRTIFVSMIPTAVPLPTVRWEGGGGRAGRVQNMWWGMMVKLRRSHLTILLLGVDQYGFMMRRQWLQEINTEPHPKVSQKIWTYHRTAIIAPWCYGPSPGSGNTRNMKLTAICLYFYGSLFQFCWLGWQRGYWLTDWPSSQSTQYPALSSLVSIFQIQDNFANFCPKLIQWAGSIEEHKPIKMATQVRKSRSTFFEYQLPRDLARAQMEASQPHTGIECLVWVKWILPELLLSQ